MNCAGNSERSAVNLERSAVPSSRAFTLLELVIVLSLMVGLLAVVWPNLQRPLQRTSLEEAAQMVRDAIDESRNQAALRGAPYFVQLHQGSSQLHSGCFESFLDSDFQSSDFTAAGSLPDAQSSTTTAASRVASSLPGPSATSSPRAGSGQPTARPTPAVRTWELPSSVVISNVEWTLERALPRSASELAASDAMNTTTGDRSRAEPDVLADDELSASSGMPEFDVANARQWWLPLTAEGRGRDATIELFDASIAQRLYVTYSAATGALEISR